MPEMIDSGGESSRGGGNENYNMYNIEERRDLNRKQTVQLGNLGKEKEYVSG
jgi:hypothetical protein